jgi:hypothetical protein
MPRFSGSHFSLTFLSLFIFSPLSIIFSSAESEAELCDSDVVFCWVVLVFRPCCYWNSTGTRCLEWMAEGCCHLVGWLEMGTLLFFLKHILELNFYNTSSLSFKCYLRTGVCTFCMRNTYSHISRIQLQCFGMSDPSRLFLSLGEEDTKCLSHTANNGKPFSSI